MQFLSKSYLDTSPVPNHLPIIAHICPLRKKKAASTWVEQLIKYIFDLVEPKCAYIPPLYHNILIIAQKRLVCKPNVAPYGRTLANKVVFWCFSPYFGIYNDKMEFFSALARKKAWHRALLGLRFTNFVRELTHSVCKRIYKYKINIKKHPSGMTERC